MKNKHVTYKNLSIVVAHIMEYIPSQIVSGSYKWQRDDRDCILYRYETRGTLPGASPFLTFLLVVVSSVDNSSKHKQ